MGIHGYLYWSLLVRWGITKIEPVQVKLPLDHFPKFQDHQGTRDTRGFIAINLRLFFRIIAAVSFAKAVGICWDDVRLSNYY